jgi:hypothetical protein
MTWQEFVTRVESVIDALGLPHHEVDVDIIDILGSTGISNVELNRLPNGRFELIVE